MVFARMASHDNMMSIWCNLRYTVSLEYVEDVRIHYILANKRKTPRLMSHIDNSWKVQPFHSTLSHSTERKQQQQEQCVERNQIRLLRSFR